jgi:hypothetical protein
MMRRNERIGPDQEEGMMPISMGNYLRWFDL